MTSSDTSAIQSMRVDRILCETKRWSASRSASAGGTSMARSSCVGRKATWQVAWAESTGRALMDLAAISLLVRFCTPLDRLHQRVVLKGLGPRL